MENEPKEKNNVTKKVDNVLKKKKRKKLQYSKYDKTEYSPPTGSWQDSCDDGWL